ncbi:phosphoglycerate mutase [Nocardioides baekrokdamisoli]|uniref:Phosphoglycerate mutase n=1 Tax=Nocardioides baekrokdamisoli TaxID=1804624 RepID=A0A3G9IC47_9ACTN|nr:histidine phosphatase family protein [Nocardioides baekrokdamisoli]BBH16480.1 phosphoglycerate mutase [Nocardioides baekrokdamisoli]
MSLFVVRHGATEWSLSGQHTSRTEIPLLPDGEEEAADLGGFFEGQDFALVLTSPRQRARRTAQLAGFPDAEVDEDLREWDYGVYEGLTRDEILERDPHWTVWDGPTPDGETPAEITARLDRLMARVRGVDGDVLVFAHGHISRALAARWIDQPVALGRNFQLDTATVSVLGDDRGAPVIERWNA